MNYFSLAAPEVVKMTTSNTATACDRNFINMTMFMFQCLGMILFTLLSSLCTNKNKNLEDHSVQWETLLPQGAPLQIKPNMDLPRLGVWAQCVQCVP